MNKTIKIGRQIIGNDHPVFIVAELSCNHNQNFKTAIKTLRAIKKAGADAVKIQVYTPDTMTIDCDNEYFQIKQGTIWDGTTLYKLYQQAYTPWDWVIKLKKEAAKLGLFFFASAFDETSVDLLVKVKADQAFKVASFEIRDLALISYMAKKGRPMILSTGVATLKDIEFAVKTCHQAGNKQVCLLKCTSAYPTPFDEVNLKTMVDLARRFKTLVGVSDHTLGSLVPTVAVSLGAKIVEKHFILDRKLGGPDGPFSMEPQEFKDMVDQIRDTEKILGRVTYKLGKQAKKGREFSRSLFVVEDIAKGEKFSHINVRSIRPGFGLGPKLLPKIIGKTAKLIIKRGTPLRWGLINFKPDKTT